MVGPLKAWLILLLCLGIFLPRATAVLSDLSPLAVSRIVICTGDGLQTILLDENGDPVDGQPTPQQHCALTHVVLSGSGVSANWTRLAYRLISDRHGSDRVTPGPKPLSRSDPPRAPPLA